MLNEVRIIALVGMALFIMLVVRSCGEDSREIEIQNAARGVTAGFTNLENAPEEIAMISNGDLQKLIIAWRSNYSRIPGIRGL